MSAGAWGFPHSSAGKESACNAGDPSSIPGLGRSPGEGIGYPLQYSWASLVAQLVKNPPAMWETWVQPRVWEDPRRRERLPIPVFCPGESHGLFSPWGRKEWDSTERLSVPVCAVQKVHTCVGCSCSIRDLRLSSAFQRSVTQRV